MGEEEKKAEEKKNPEEEKKENPPAPAPENKSDEGKAEETAAPPPPPPEIVLRVYMHCEGCARKVKKSLKGFDGVEDVITDCKTHKVVVKGEKADPVKVFERVRRKNHRHVDLLSPIPPPAPPSDGGTEKPAEAEPPKPEEKKEEPKVITVVLKVHMHCEACAQEMKKRIERMKEVEEAIPDLKGSVVTVKGTFDPQNLVKYVYKRTGKHAFILKQDPPEKMDDKGKEGKEEKNGEEGKKGEEKGGEEGKGDKKEGGGDGGVVALPAEGGAEEAKVMEFKRNEYYYYPPRYGMEMYAYPPQIFSDENPNACSIM